MKRETIIEWVKSLAVTGGIFLLFTIYLYLRRGYVNLYIINKVMGSTAAALAAITLILGPLSRVTDTFDRYVVLRKPLGILALVLALLHAIISLFFLPTKFPLSWYQREIVPVALGVLAIAVWIYLAHISTDAWLKRLGKRWRIYQNIGARIAFGAIFLHLVIMKYPGWLRWFNGQITASPELANPQYPPASLFVFTIMLGVILYRTINPLKGK